LGSNRFIKHLISFYLIADEQVFSNMIFSINFVIVLSILTQFGESLSRSITPVIADRINIFRKKQTIFSTPTDDNEPNFGSYREDSLKSAVVSTLGGSIGSAPLAIIIGYQCNFNSQWEFAHDGLAI
jgi:hypothetical protein